MGDMKSVHKKWKSNMHLLCSNLIMWDTPSLPVDSCPLGNWQGFFLALIYLCWISYQIDCMTYHEQLQQQHQQKQHVLLGLWFPGAWETADVPSFCDCCLFLISATSVPQWLQEHRHKRTWSKCNSSCALSKPIALVNALSHLLTSTYKDNH